MVLETILLIDNNLYIEIIATRRQTSGDHERTNIRSFCKKIIFWCEFVLSNQISFLQDFELLLQIFALLLQIFVLLQIFAVLFGINCTEIDQ